MLRKYSCVFAVLAIILACFNSNIFAATRLPHYFPEGIESVNTPVEQWEAYYRYLNATSHCFSPNENSFPRFFENSIKIERNLYGEKLIFIFDPWKRNKEGKIIFADFCGQKIISEDDFNLVAEDFIDEFKRAVEEIDEPYYRYLESLAVRAAAKKKGMTEEVLRPLLDKPVPEDPKHEITYREINRIPMPVTKASFVKHIKQREVHFGFISALGEVWLNSGITYISLQARILDYMTGDKPVIMAHEAIHANSILQNFPLSEGWDVELAASIPAMLLSDDKIYLIFHSYLRDPRELIWVFFGFDFEKIHKEVVLFNYDGNIRIDAKKFDYYAEKLEEAKAELLRFFHDEAIPEFYSDPTFWTAMGEKLQDKNAFVRIMMVTHYEPTILGGREATAKWNDSHKQEIIEMAKKAYAQSGKPSSGDEKNPVHHKFQSLATRLGLDQDDLLSLAKRYHIKPEELSDKTDDELLLIFFSILDKEGKGMAKGERQ